MHTQTPIHIDEQTVLTGTLAVPYDCAGSVIFAHGSGSSRLSPRNVQVAEFLQNNNCATLLFDLLTDEEAQNRANVFDIPLLARRMIAATQWLLANADEVAKKPIGYFGASTGAAAALVAAAEGAHDIAAIVSRGGRPDLAGDALPKVTAPTLLLVGSLDGPVIDMNRDAQSQMTCETQLSIIEGASHLFEEPGTLEEVAHQAAEWFTRWFR